MEFPEFLKDKLTTCSYSADFIRFHLHVCNICCQKLSPPGTHPAQTEICWSWTWCWFCWNFLPVKRKSFLSTVASVLLIMFCIRVYCVVIRTEMTVIEFESGLNKDTFHKVCLVSAPVGSLTLLIWVVLKSALQSWLLLHGVVKVQLAPLVVSGPAVLLRVHSVLYKRVSSDCWTYF